MEEIRLEDMEPGVRYVAVTGGATIRKGDHLKMEEYDRAISCREAYGWINEADWKKLRTRVVVDREYYVRKREGLMKECKAIDEFLAKNGLQDEGKVVVDG